MVWVIEAYCIRKYLNYGYLDRREKSMLKSSICNLKLYGVYSFLSPKGTLLSNIITFLLLMNKILSDDPNFEFGS